MIKNPKTKEELLKELATLQLENQSLKAKYEQDIAERIWAEETLGASEIRYRRLFESAKDGILILDAETGKIVDVNTFLIELLGYTKEQFIEKEIWEIGFFKDIIMNKEKFLELQQKGYVRYEDLPLETDSGKKISVEFVSNVYLVNKTKVIQCNIRDITERKRVEDEKKLTNEKLMTLNGEKDKFFSIIAHDLRSPFQSFLNLTKMLAEDAKSFSSEDLSELGSNMNKSATNLFTLLQNLFEWANMQKGSINFQPAELSLSELISANVELVNQRSRQKGTQVINKAANPVYVYADKNMVNSVLSNLLWNAVKFTNKNGTIAVNAKKNDNKLIEISVKDTGVGISKCVIDNLFKVGGNTGSKGTDGELSTGLGLLLCKEFVEKNGGKIWVESEEGVGSTFYFTLPEKDGAFPQSICL